MDHPRTPTAQQRSFSRKRRLCILAQKSNTTQAQCPSFSTFFSCFPLPRCLLRSCPQAEAEEEAALAQVSEERSLEEQEEAAKEAAKAAVEAEKAAAAAARAAVEEQEAVHLAGVCRTHTCTHTHTHTLIHAMPPLLLLLLQPVRFSPRHTHTTPLLLLPAAPSLFFCCVAHASDIWRFCAWRAAGRLRV